MERLYETAMSDLDFEGTIEPLEEMMRAILADSHLGECSYNGSCGKNILCIFANGEMGFCGRAEQEKENFGQGGILPCGKKRFCGNRDEPFRSMRGRMSACAGEAAPVFLPPCARLGSAVRSFYAKK